MSLNHPFHFINEASFGRLCSMHCARNPGTPCLRCSIPKNTEHPFDAKDLYHQEEHAPSILQMLDRDRKGTKVLTDGVLQVENQTFAVHKCIIGVVSGYLENLFYNKKEERYGNVAQINGITPDRMERLLEYSYLGQTKLTSENVCDTLEDAFHVQLTRLAQDCATFMEKSMTTDNCLRFLVCARKYSIPMVVSKAYVTISHFAHEILQLDDFKLLPVDDVIRILRLHEREIVEEEILVCCEKWFNHEPETRRDNFASLLELVDFSFLSNNFIEERIPSNNDQQLHPEYNAKLLKEFRDRKTKEEKENCSQCISEKIFGHEHPITGKVSTAGGC